MATFTEANQAKLSLKMMLSNYHWYNSITISQDGNDWILLVSADKIDNSVRKVVPIVHNGISVKVDAATKSKKKLSK